MKKFFKSAAALILGCFLFAGSACAQPVIPGSEIQEQIDHSRTQLYVYTYYGGFGTDWLSAVKERFEELHKDDDHWEEGKKGVQVYINPQKEDISTISSQILDSRDEIYFTEYAYYYTLRSEGVLGDISEAVTQPLAEYGETRSIADKMNDAQRSYFGVQENGATHYYGVPHYAGYSGLIYNKDLFDEEDFYFAAEPSDNTLEGRFIDQYNTEKSAGPDGLTGTFDDGLPTTYEEFFLLCDFIASSGMTPVAWNGTSYKTYLNNFMQSLVTTQEGYDQMMLNFTLNGDAKTLVTLQGGEPVPDASAIRIDNSNGYELARQAGKYYALEFMERLIGEDDYHNTLAFNGGYSHLNAQEDFLKAGNDGQTAPIAMLVDGCWWEMEADSIFDEMVASRGESFSKYNRNFGFMPLPKATQARADENLTNGEDGVKWTLYDELYSLCFMKANIAEWKKPLALEFIRFVNSDESLSEFTAVTNTVKALDYQVRAEDTAQLTPFGRSLVEVKESAEIVYPFSTNSVYVNNQRYFTTAELYKATVGSEKSWPSEAMHDENISAAQYFEGLLTYQSAEWSSLLV